MLCDGVQSTMLSFSNFFMGYVLKGVCREIGTMYSVRAVSWEDVKSIVSV